MTNSSAQLVLLTVVLVGFPVWDVIVTRRLRAAALSGDIQARTCGYIQTVVALWIVAGAAIALTGLRAVATIRPPAGVMPDPSAFLPVVAGLGIGLIAATVGMVVAARKRGSVTNKMVKGLDWFLPVTASQRRWWIVMSLTAGITEEIFFRGFVMHVLRQPPLALSFFVAAAISCGAFGLNHIYQGIAGVVLTTIMGAAFMLLFVATGNLALPIFVHALIDLRVLLVLPKPADATR